jgi:hypothetical protein
MPTPFATRLARIAIEQHSRFHMEDEGDPLLSAQIERYYDDLGFDFENVEVPWSAVFVSWCVKQAGADEDEFRFSKRHSVFVNRAIRNDTNDTGVFRGVPFNAHPPGIGDIIQNNRSGNSFNFNHAKNNTQYDSHSAIVVEIGHDNLGGFALTIGGNEGDSIRRKVVRLNESNLIKQRPTSSFICLVRDLK